MTTLIAQSIIGDTVKELLTAQALKYQVGHQIFCPACQNVMDWQSAVGVDLVKANDSNELIFTRAFCARCFDNGISANIPKTIEEAKAKCQCDVEAQVIDGREYLDELTLLNYKIAPSLQDFRTRWKDGWVDVQGHRVELPSMPWAGQWFVYKFPDKDRWSMVEESTGFSAGGSGTMKGAVIAGTRALHNCGEEKFKTVMAKAQKTNAKLAKQQAKKGVTP